MIRLAIILLWLLPGAVLAQSSTVLPRDAEIKVTIENADRTPYTQEMVLITIDGFYRRHITRERLIQPDLEGVNWMQLGSDHWFDDTERGLKVKRFRRRMALFPERPGEIEIGAFTHQLTLTDEQDNWFDYEITSEPVTLKVDPAPKMEAGDWWFPVRRLEVADSWSNAPDQLAPGEGVLRVIRIEATGVGPDMIPPMPELTSPSAMIFPHPEKRLVELSPLGPVAIAFWRWTIRPTNDTSTIVEPIRFSFFDTENRVAREVEISPQRIAYDETLLPPPEPPQEPAQLHPLLSWGLGALAFVVGIAVALSGRQIEPSALRRRLPWVDPLARRLFRAERAGDDAALRRAARAVIRRDGPSAERAGLLARLDRRIFDPSGTEPRPTVFARRFLRADPNR